MNMPPARNTRSQGRTADGQYAGMQASSGATKKKKKMRPCTQGRKGYKGQDPGKGRPGVVCDKNKKK